MFLNPKWFPSLPESIGPCLSVRLSVCPSVMYRLSFSETIRHRNMQFSQDDSPICSLVQVYFSFFNLDPDRSKSGKTDSRFRTFRTFNTNIRVWLLVLYVFGVADFKSELRFVKKFIPTSKSSKNRTRSYIWSDYIFSQIWECDYSFYMFLGSLISNLNLDL